MGNEAVAIEEPLPAVSGLRRAANAQPLRVLLVDDEGMVRKVLTRMLAARGVQVKTASTVSEARSLFDGDHEFDLLITDVMIPDGGGVALARKLSEIQPALRVLFVSGYAASNETQTWRHDRARFLTKPFGSAELVEAIVDLFPGLG
jgi:two-component system cell cycle response regulator CpdR